jgi:GNAT superfamily N-acetyltransferase
MTVDSLGFRTDLMLRQLAGSSVRDHGTHLVVRTPQNPGYYWGNFVLVRAARSDAHRWLEVFATEFPGAAHVAIGLDATVADEGDVRGYVAAGLTPDISTVLTATALSPRRSAVDAVLRPLHGDDDWRESLRLRRLLDDDDSPAHRAFSERKVAEYRRLVEDGAGTWFGAFVADRLVTQLGVFGDGSGVARYQAVETDPDYRRRGLATALIQLAGEHALREGARRLVIVADPDYHAIDIYRGLGFVEAEAQVQLQRPS